MPKMKLSGLLVPFSQPMPVYGGPEPGGGWSEQVAPGSFGRALAERDRVPVVLVPRDGPTDDIRNVIGMAKLTVDDQGVHFEAEIQVGYSFRVKHQYWNSDMSARVISEMDIVEVFLPGKSED